MHFSTVLLASLTNFALAAPVAGSSDLATEVVYARPIARRDIVRDTPLYDDVILERRDFESESIPYDDVILDRRALAEEPLFVAYD